MEFVAVASGFYLEGIGVDGNKLWFSDVVQGGLHCLAPDGTKVAWVPERHWIGSVLFNSDGAVLCSGIDGIAWFHPVTGASGMLLGAIDEQPLRGVNEIVPDGQGGIYFGTMDIASMAQGEPLGPSALYRLTRDGRVSHLAGDLQFPNGIGVSADGKRLFHNDTRVGTYAYDFLPDGSLGNRALLLEGTDGDGVAIDADGNVWVTGYLTPELLCLKPDGTILNRIALPGGDGATNLRFGGKDGRDFFVTTVPRDVVEEIIAGKPPTSPRSVLYRGRSDVPGRVLARTDFRLT